MGLLGRWLIVPELHQELFKVFVDTIENVKGRLPAWFLLAKARAISRDLRRIHQARNQRGEVPAALLRLPVLDGAWLLRWRASYNIAWRTVALRCKCPDACVVAAVAPVLVQRVSLAMGVVPPIRLISRMAVGEL